MSPILNERQKKALRGELSLEDWNEVAPSLFEERLVGFDPLAKLAGDKTEYRLTEKGIAEAKRLRALAARHPTEDK